MTDAPQLLKKQTNKGEAKAPEVLLTLGSHFSLVSITLIAGAEDLKKAYWDILDEQDMERKQRCMGKILKCNSARILYCDA